MFSNRQDAGRKLGHKLLELNYPDHFLVLGLARGGVPVAAEVANALGAPLDVFVVRKLGLPGHEELAIGAIAPLGTIILNKSVVREYAVDRETIMDIAKQQEEEIDRCLKKYRQGNTTYDIEDKDILIIDDGLATGATMKVAVDALRALKPSSIHVAVPVASPATCKELKDRADAVVCLRQPEYFFGVGQFYQDFDQIGDEQVIALLKDNNNRSHWGKKSS